MRFLGIGEYCDLAALYLRLVEEGHEVKVSIANPFCQGTLAGMVEHVADWRNALDWIKSAGLEGMLLFENVAHGSGELQDALRADGFNVVGGSAFGDRLENDRAFAQRVLAQAGLAIARHWEFQDAKSACEFLKKNQRRCVLKFNGPEAAIEHYVVRLHDGSPANKTRFRAAHFSFTVRRKSQAASRKMTPLATCDLRPVAQTL